MASNVQVRSESPSHNQPVHLGELASYTLCVCARIDGRLGRRVGEAEVVGCQSAQASKCQSSAGLMECGG